VEGAKSQQLQPNHEAAAFQTLLATLGNLRPRALVA
jgi:hypothetical protein